MRLLSPVLPAKLNTLMTLLWADNCTESFFNAANCLDIFGWLGFILNLTKFIFSKTLSHVLDLKSPIWQSAPMEKISRSHSEVSYSYQPHCHAFMLGLVNQVPYACATINHVLSFQLLKPGITFEWINDQSVSILGKKKKGVCIFDHAKPIGLTTDLSKSEFETGSSRNFLSAQRLAHLLSNLMENYKLHEFVNLYFFFVYCLDIIQHSH